MRMDGKFIKPGTVAEEALDVDFASKTAMLTPAGAATGAAVVLLEGTENGVQKVTLQGPAALTGDRTIHVPDEDVNLEDIAGHIADAEAAHAATAISFAADGGDLASTDVNAAIEELEGELDIAKALQTGPLTVVAMGDAAHTLVVGTAGANQTKIVNNIVVADAESTGLSEDLAFPAAADFVGMLFVANSGGKDIVLTSAGSQVLGAGEMAIFSSDGTGWAPFGRFVLSGTQYAALKVVLAGTATVIDMAGVAHAIVIGTAGPAETQLTNRTVLADANGAPAALTLPDVGDFEGFLIVTNIGGENITTPAPAGTILPGTTAIFASDGTSWRRLLIDALDAYFDDSIAGLGVNTVQEAIDAFFGAVMGMTYTVPFFAPALAIKATDGFHAQYSAGGGSAMDISTAFTDVYPARNIELATNATYDGGDITVDGKDINGESIQEVLTPVPGGGVIAGVKAFKSITQAVSENVVTVASEVDFGTGDYFAMSAPLHATDGLMVATTDGTVDAGAAVQDADTGCLSTTATPDGTKDFAGALRVLMS